MEYDGDFQLSAIAQSCRRFTSRNKLRKGYGASEASISCSNCGNWDGSKCLAQSFDRVMTDLDLN